MSDPKSQSKPAVQPAADPAMTISQANASIDTSRTGSPAEKAAAETPVPKAFGRYKIEKELGKGAMGVVYLAEDTQLGRKVALKIPRKSSLEDAEALERFYREARTAGTLRHNNICPVYDVGAIDGVHYLTMAYIPGKPVSSFVSKDKFPTAKQVALLIRKIALALAEAHRNGVIHRDLKPSNVMLDDRGEPIVMDFGLARQMNSAENARLTQSGAILGTPAYMAPEQVRGETDAIGPQADIYALGVMLYQFLTGELPFSGPIMMVFAQILTEQPKLPSQLRPDVDPTLESICLKMIAKNVTERYASMKDVAGALTEYLKSGSAPKPQPVVQSPQEPEYNFENLEALPVVVEAPRSQRKRKNAKPQSLFHGRTRTWPLVAAASGVVLLGLFAAVIYFVTGAGTVALQIDCDDPSLKVEFAGDSLTISDGEKTFRVRPGAQKMTVSGDGFQTDTKEFRITRGETRRLTVTLVDGKPTLIDTRPDRPRDPPNKLVDKAQEKQEEKSTPTDETAKATPANSIETSLGFPLADPPPNTQREFPPGQWVRVFTSPEEIAGIPGAKLTDGVLDLTNVNVTIPGLNAKDVAIRAKVKRLSGGNVEIKVRRTSNGFYQASHDANGRLKVQEFDGEKLKDRQEAKIGMLEDYFDLELTLREKLLILVAKGQQSDGRVVFQTVAESLTQAAPGRPPQLVGDETAGTGSVALCVFQGQALFKDVEVQVLETAPATVAPLNAKQRWVHEGGEFRMIGKDRWEESSPNGKRYSFQEIKRTENYVELDALTGDTKIRVRLYDTRCDFAWKPALNFTRKFTGQWASISTQAAPSSPTIVPLTQFAHLDSDFVFTTALSPDGKLVAGGNLKATRIWNVADGSTLLDLKLEAAMAPRTLLFSPDNKHLVWGGWDNQEIRLYDVKTGEKTRTMEGNSGIPISLCFSQDGTQLLSGGQGRRLGNGYDFPFGPNTRVWDVETGKALRKFEGSNVSVGGFWLDDNRRAVSRDGTSSLVRLWDTETGKEERIFSRDLPEIWAVSLSPNNKYVAAGLKNSVALVWDVSTGQQLQRFESAGNPKFTPDGGHLLCSTGNGASLRMWEVKSGAEVLRVEQKLPDGVGAVHVFPKGDRALISTYQSGHVYTIPLTIPKPTAAVPAPEAPVAAHKFPPGQWVRVFTTPEEIAGIPGAKLEGGVLELNDTNVAIPGLVAKDVAIRAKVKRLSGESVELKVRKSSSGYYQAYHNARGQIGIQKFVKGIRGLNDQRLAPQKDYFDFQLQVKGEELTLTAAGRDPQRARDAAFKSGEVAVSAFKSRALFKDIEVQVLDGAPMPQPAAANSARLPTVDRTQWTILGGQWSIIDEELQNAPDGSVFTHLFFGDPSWKDFDFTVDFLRLDGDSSTALLFRQDSTDIDPRFYLFGIGLGNNGDLYVPEVFTGGRNDQGQPIWRTIAPRRNFRVLNNGTWYTASVVVRGNRIQCSIKDDTNETSLFDVSDNQFAAGRVGLRCGRSTYRFKNIKVTDPDGKVLWEGLPDLDGKSKTPPALPNDAPPPAVAPFNAEQAQAHQAAWAEHLGVPVEWENSIGMKFRLIPPGEFLMGATDDEVKDVLKELAKDPDTQKSGWANHVRSGLPRHTVRLTRPFYLGAHEVTQAQYQSVIGVNPSGFAAGTVRSELTERIAGRDTRLHPVEAVSWTDAASFCNRLGQIESLEQRYTINGNAVRLLSGAGYHLPTEAQWEFACRAGTVTRFHGGATLADFDGVGWYGKNSGQRTHLVGELATNAFGLFDMHGNVQEWSQDAWASDDYAIHSDQVAIDPVRPPASDDELVAVRGGGWGNFAEICFSSTRMARSGRASIVGFRIALPVEAVQQAMSKQTASAPPPAVAPFNAEQAKAHQSAWAKHLGVPVEFTNKLGMKFVLIPPGKFQQGSAASDPDAESSEKPQRQGIVSTAFYLGSHEVTLSQFRAFVEAEKVTTEAEQGAGSWGFNVSKHRFERVPKLSWRSPGFTQGDDHPVVCASWGECRRFCDWLNKTQPSGYRLLTEAEWEFACRAGTATRYSTGDDSNSIRARGNVADLAIKGAWTGYPSQAPYGPLVNWDDGYPFTSPVGKFPANPFGIHDMIGNVREFCGAESPVLRGGSFSNSAATQRSATRVANRGMPDFAIGFRVALSADAVKRALAKSDSPAPDAADPRFYAIRFGQ